MRSISEPSRGMTLIDVLVGSALVLIIFLALMGMLRASIAISTLSKARAGAASISESQMEYLRGLSYDALGTIGGIPSGLVPPAQTETLNGISYTVHTYIQYVDSPADGLGIYDTNGITTDYKVAKVTVDYQSGGITRSDILVSNFSPPSIETTNGGGTLTISVVNALGAPVAGATVHITDTALTPAIDMSAFSNSSGSVSLPGAPPSTDYQIDVTKSGYSSAQTYKRDTTNQNPTPGYLTVVKEQITTGTFAIDTLASLTLRTYKPLTTNTFSDTFTNESSLVATSSVIVSSGAIVLSSSALSGSARSISVTPALLHAWKSVQEDSSVASGSSILVHVYTGTDVLIPDSVLPGNSTGFSTFPIDLSNIATSTYPALSIGANISRTGTAIVPKLLDWSLSYKVGPVPIPNVAFTLTGAKTIGSTGAGAPIYKTIVSKTTNASGQNTMTLEWDAYSLAISGYDIQDACPLPPYPFAPSSVTTASLTLVSATPNMLLVGVRDTNGNPISGVSVTVSGAGGYSKTVSSSSCANAYFGGLSSSNTYTITLAKSGYTTTIIQNISISGQTFKVATFQ